MRSWYSISGGRLFLIRQVSIFKSSLKVPKEELQTLTENIQRSKTTGFHGSHHKHFLVKNIFNFKKNLKKGMCFYFFIHTSSFIYFANAQFCTTCCSIVLMNFVSFKQIKVHMNSLISN